MRHSQSSLIELLVIAIGVSACLTLLLLFKNNSIESISAASIESEELLLNYLNYRFSGYNETMLFLITQQCSNQSFYQDFISKTRSVIEYLNNNNSFILFINISNSAWKVYNQQETVCLTEARLSEMVINTPCGTGKIVYGSWTGEAPITC